MAGVEVNRIIEFGPFVISKGACTITLGALESKVSPRSMDVLIYLIEHSDRVVGTDELLQAFWSSLASDHAVHKAVAELRAAMGDSVRRQRFIRTVPKRGYKVLGAVMSDSAAIIPEAQEQIAPLRQKLDLLDIRQWLVGTAAVLILAGLGLVANAGYLQHRDTPLVICLAPFNLESNGLDPDPHLINGLTSTLINGLSNLGSLQLIASGCNEIDAEYISRFHLSPEVTHVLQGVVFQSGEKLRVITNLIRSRDGIYEYSARFDISQGELLELQDLISNNIISGLKAHIDEDRRAVRRTGLGGTAQASDFF